MHTSDQPLPIPDYDHLPGLTIASRTGSLERAEVETLLDYESGHRNRTPVVRLLYRRLRHLREAARTARRAPSRGSGYGPPSAPAPRSRL